MKDKIGGTGMTTKRLIEIATSHMLGILCEGCEEEFYDGENYGSCDECCKRASALLYARLSNGDPEMCWIPCEYTEPEEDQECWFTVNDRGFRYVNRGCFTRRYGERRDKGFITAGGFAWWNTAIAWMPIPEPEPYKGKTE